MSVRTESGGILHAGNVVVSAGTWTHLLVPELAAVMKSSGHPVFHLQVEEETLFSPPGFVVFTADVARTGWYGFPVNQEGIVKVANHGLGKPMGPDDSRDLTPSDVSKVRKFLQESLPILADAPLVNSRLCLYCDTWDGDFWIGRDPNREGLVVAAGGSGHGFKFAPVMGGVIADAVEGIDTPYTQLFAWRPKGERKTEATRYLGE